MPSFYHDYCGNWFRMQGRPQLRVKHLVLIG
jgi:hypothetical protein